ncbi:PepSY-associated TM helix domain-containing protein [Catenovulum sediminis]|uniref:PepSY domain-containing protein n=1 Tax=Catenovulum sediminis TaxID=1740262 RepID=A0ABV1RFP1_9ALTE
MKTRVAYSKLQQRVWRWHFYAGLMVIPFALILALSGSLYLFKPQISAFYDEQINKTIPTGQVAKNAQPLNADRLLDITLQRYPNAQLKKYFPTDADDPSVEMEIKTNTGHKKLWVNKYNGELIAEKNVADLPLNIVKNIHGELLAGNKGSYLVEFMACWMIVLLISGLYLWWPNKTLLPNFKSNNKREVWRSLHTSLGIWFSLLILVFLLTGLPWTQVWGEGFKRIQNLIQLKNPGQEWNVTLTSSPSEHVHDDGLDLWTTQNKAENVTLVSQHNTQQQSAVSLQRILQKPTVQKMHMPIEVYPPKMENGVWTVRSMTQYRPDRVTVHFDKWSGEEIMRITFADYNTLKQVVALGISLHEGALFGWLNQLLGVLVTLAIILLSVSGFIIWWKRKPQGKLAAPKKPAATPITFAMTVAITVLAVFLPLVGLSIIAVFIFELSWYLISKLKVKRKKHKRLYG